MIQSSSPLNLHEESRSQALATKKDHVIFLCVIFCFWFCTYVYIPVFSLYLESIHFTYSMIGIILGSYGLTQILLRFPLGVLSDKLFGIRKHLLTFGFLAGIASGLFLLFSESFIAIFIARLLAGVTAAMWVMATVLYSHYVKEQFASKAMSRVQFLTVFAQFISMMISGYLVYYFGWKAPFLVATVAAVVGTILVLQVKDFSVRRENALPLSYYLKQTFRIRGLLFITFLSLGAHSILFITIFGFSPMYVSQLTESSYAVTVLVCAFFIPHALAAIWLMFRTIKQQSQIKILIISFMLTALFALLVPFVQSWIFVVLLHAGLGVSLGFIFPLLLAMVIQVSDASLKNSAMGFYQSFYALGIMGGPLLAGELAELTNLLSIFYLCGIMAVICTIVVVVIQNSRVVYKKREVKEAKEQ
ncbi:MFS transporter [Alkalihalobacillus hemicellulosilyticus]|uniref:Putative transport protein n=1 Tax=Halalkalibacter hemicellulosilyticusJCM 9152 TaxID=1236971 RepID=W4QEV0_9BACI|nr:MFS transporter [Halalkalibacter hemicellulosilyticus]GAE29869.1 putative transport protein [Halalkalibacter hemicellulosilyticusJCM 9152]